MPLKKGAMTLVAEAEREVDTLTPEAAMKRSGQDDCVIVDLRDIRERTREGFVPGSLHVPRGMLEFWIDPDTPYYKDVFGSGKHFVFYCQSGWRSALAAKTVKDMGLSPVSHIGGGFAAWVEDGGEVLKTEDGREPRKGK
jgi:rhodanese-related sulfurtransferase